jgi:hypothetical protein
MPIYEVEQYELHVERYRDEANREAEAIAGLFNGKADPVDGSLEFIEVADDVGLPVDDNADLADALRALDIAIGFDIIPSIRSIKEIAADQRSEL